MDYLPMSLWSKFLCGISIAQNYTTRKKIHYIGENASWVIDDIGTNITPHLSEFRITNTFFGIKKRIIHFGSIHVIPKNIKILEALSQSNILIATCFHIDQKGSNIPELSEIDNYIERWHTSCSITKGTLIKNGIKPEKITIIPLGVDLNWFSPANPEKRIEIRKNLNVSEGKVVIGSFQKDGIGWGTGLEPKLIKGPDIFLDVIARLKEDFDIHCLLTGPARGYVKNNLERMDVSYTHKYLNDPRDVAIWFQACDLYIMASRLEGGPKSILESLACGVPLVATRVGMVPDILQDGENAFLTEIEDIDAITQKSRILLNNQTIAEKHIENGLRLVKNYSWDIISMRYYKELYREFL